MRDKSDMRAVQGRATTRLYEGDAVQAIMPMGSGKTAAAMTAIRELIDDRHIRCALVLAPKRVAQLVWMKEHLLWAHLAGLRIRHVAGGPKQRHDALFDAGGAPADIYVVGIDNTQWLMETLKALPRGHKLFDLLCIDELSRFKNPRGKRARALQKQADRFGVLWGLTGTPRPTGYEDQYRPLQLLTKGQLWKRSFDRWREERFMPLDFNGYNWSIRPEWRQRTLDDIARYSFTVSDEDLPDLEPIVPVFHWIDLPPKALATYKDMERKLLVRREGGNILAANRAVATGKLAQAANGFMYGEGGNEDVLHLHSEKFDALVDLVEGVDSEPMLIGYEFREELRTLREMWPGLPYFGAGISDAAAQENETRWNRREYPLMALHPASAGHGLNLQYGGSQFVWLSMPWSAELYDQTLKRFHRPGQTKRCFAHHILARNTVDEMKYDRVVKRMTEQEAFRNYMEKI